MLLNFKLISLTSLVGEEGSFPAVSNSYSNYHPQKFLGYRDKLENDQPFQDLIWSDDCKSGIRRIQSRLLLLPCP